MNIMSLFLFNLQTHLSTNQIINRISWIVLCVTYSRMLACIKSTSYIRNLSTDGGSFQTSVFQFIQFYGVKAVGAADTKICNMYINQQDAQNSCD